MRNYGQIKLVEKENSLFVVGFNRIFLNAGRFVCDVLLRGPDSDDENIGGAMTAIFGFVFA